MTMHDDPQIQPELRTAVKEGDTTTLERLLEDGANVNAADATETAPIHLAADEGHEAVLELLLTAGASPKAKTKSGWTALHLAAAKGHTKIVDRLLRAGANPSAATKYGKTARAVAIEHGHETTALLLQESGGTHADAHEEVQGQDSEQDRTFLVDDDSGPGQLFGGIALIGVGAAGLWFALRYFLPDQSPESAALFTVVMVGVGAVSSSFEMLYVVLTGLVPGFIIRMGWTLVSRGLTVNAFNGQIVEVGDESQIGDGVIYVPVVPSFLSRPGIATSVKVSTGGAAPDSQAPSQLIDALVAGLQDQDAPTRLNAAIALSELGEAAVDAAAPVLRGGSMRAKQAAALALGGSGAPRAAEHLVQAATDTRSEVRWAVAKSLGNLGEPTTTDTLHGLLTDEDESVRTEAALNLGKMGDPRSVPPLVEILEQHPEVGSRYQAAKALKELADPRSADALHRIAEVDSSIPVFGQLDGTVPDLRDACNAALEAIREREASGDEQTNGDGAPNAAFVSVTTSLDDMSPASRLESELETISYEGGAPEAFYERMSADLTSRHAPLVSVDYLSHFPKFEIWFCYQDGTRLYSGERTGDFDIHFLSLGYVGEGPRYARHFLAAAGLDLSTEEIESIEAGDSIQRSGERAIIVRAGERVKEESTLPVEFSHERQDVVAGFPATYRHYRAPDKDTAKAFLDEQEVTAQSFFIVVETPEGAISKDRMGVFEG